MRENVKRSLDESNSSRLSAVLEILEIPLSSWYSRKLPEERRKRPGPAAKAIAGDVEEAVVAMARENPWYGYKRIAVMCRRSGLGVTDRVVYLVMKRHGLLKKRSAPKAEVYQAAKLYELLPQKPNDLWQCDVTYVHIPGHGWHYAVTVIDYFSRYLLACHLTTSYSAAETTQALKLAREEAERIHGPLKKPPFLVTDNGSSFLARRFLSFVREKYSHVRIRYRTPTQLGLLERFHKTLKEEEIYWRLYDDVAHARRCLGEFRERYNHRRPHWALVPERGGDPLVPAEVYSGAGKVVIPKWQAWARGAKARLDELLQKTG